MRGNEVDMESVRQIVLKHLETYADKPGMRTMTKICQSYHITDMSFYRAIDVLEYAGLIDSVGKRPKVYNLSIPKSDDKI